MEKVQILKKCVFLLCASIAILLVFMVMLRYDVEGEKKMPYKLSKILVVSTIEGNNTDDGTNIWNINLKQTNDLYLYIDKDENADKTIKEVTLQNFKFENNPLKGDIVIYRPTGDLSNLYTSSQQNYFGGSITYKGDKIDDLKTLEISNTGGIIGFRVALENLGSYVSSDTTEVTYDGNLLNAIGVSFDDLKSKFSFDILIKTNDDVTYQGNVNVDLPSSDLFEKGSGNYEITDFSNVIYKRI